MSSFPASDLMSFKVDAGTFMKESHAAYLAEAMLSQWGTCFLFILYHEYIVCSWMCSPLLSTDGTVGTPVHRRGLDLMAFNGSFQLKWFYVPYFSPSTKMFLILLHRLKLLQMHSALLWASCESVSTTAQDSKGSRWRLRSFPPSSFPR